MDGNIQKIGVVGRTNFRVKAYPTFDIYQIANTDMFRQGTYVGKKMNKTVHNFSKKKTEIKINGKQIDKVLKNADRSKLESMKRARSKVRDISLLNGFTHMFTWTLNKEKINRYDANNLLKRLNIFLSNITRRKDFMYVLVPEYHQDGAIHMHGLCRLGGVKVVDSGLKTTRGQTIYNMPEWKYGFSTCVHLDDNYEKACNYITKYITKAQNKGKIFGKWYLSSRELIKEPKKYYIEAASYYETVEGMKGYFEVKEYEVYKGRKISQWRFDHDEELYPCSQWGNSVDYEQFDLCIPSISGNVTSRKRSNSSGNSFNIHFQWDVMA